MDQQTLGEFPHSNDDVSTLVEVEPKPTSNNYNRDPLSLEDRFPELSFRHKQDQAKFTYLGKHTEKYHPFYVRFDLKTKVDQPSQPQFSQALSRLATLKASDSPNIPNQFTKDHPQQQLFSISAYEVSQAYLLIGIAKPSTTANQIFDKLFSTQSANGWNKASNEPSQSQNEGSNISNESGNEELYTGASALAGYHQIRRRWHNKLTSYEYFRFMSRIYLQLENKKLSPSDIAKELFYNTPPVAVQLRDNKTQLTSSISDEEYYYYFQSLFALHARHIQQQMAAFEATPAHRQKKNMGLILSGRTFPLYKIDYEQQIKSMFEGVELPTESIGTMAAHYAHKYNRVVEEFNFTTKAQRLRMLEGLRGEGDAVLPRVELVELVSRKHSERSQEIVNMLVVVTSPGSLNSSAPEAVTLQQVIANSKPNELATDEAYREFLLLKKELFTYILAINNNQHTPLAKVSGLVKHFSLNPRNILYNSQRKRCFPDLDYCLRRALKLEKLPLTDQQAMLSMTPSPYVDIYQTLQSIIDDLTPTSQILAQYAQSSPTNQDFFADYAERYCKALSNERLTFRYLKDMVKAHQKKLNPPQIPIYQLEENLDYFFNAIRTTTQMQQVGKLVNLNQKQYEEYLKICSAYISAKETRQLLLMSMMEYEVETQQKCIVSCEARTIQHVGNGHKESKMMSQAGRRQLLRSNQLQQKEAYQMGMLMLISCRAVNLIECQQLKAKKIDLNIRSNLENDACDSFNNLSRIKKVVEENLLKNYKTYLRYLYQHNANKQLKEPAYQNQREMFFEERTFLSMVNLYDSLNGSLQSAYQRSLIKAAFLLQLYDNYLNAVLKIIEIPSKLQQMLLIQQTHINPTSIQLVEGIVREYLQQIYNQNTVPFLENQSYKAIKLDLDKKKPAIQKIFQQIQRIRRDLEEKFNPNKRQHKNNTFEYLIDSVYQLTNQPTNSRQRLKAVLLQEQTNIDEPFKQKVIRKRFQIRKAKARLFCEVYESRRQVRQIKEQQGFGKAVEYQFTLNLLMFFLCQSSFFNKELLDVPRTDQMGNLLIQCNKIMITEILSAQIEINRQKLVEK